MIIPPAKGTELLCNFLYHQDNLDWYEIFLFYQKTINKKLNKVNKTINMFSISTLFFKENLFK